MAKLIYASNMSVDGWTEDERGAFDWAPPGDDVFAFITALMRSAGTYLYGRRMYETLAVWETDSTRAAQSDLMADYAPYCSEASMDPRDRGASRARPVGKRRSPRPMPRAGRSTTCPSA